MARKFVNLHNHSGASMYDGLGKPKDHSEWMLENAGEDSGALALTNHGSINDIGPQVEDQMEYEKSGTPCKMIYGVEAYYIDSLPDWRKLKESIEEEKAKDKKYKKEVMPNDLVIEDEEESKKKKFNPLRKSSHLIVLAQNQKGLENLFRLVSRSYREGFYAKPRMDLNMLKEHNEGLILSTACIGGIAGGAYWDTQDDEITTDQMMKLYDERLGPLMDIFGKERFYLELQFNKIPEQQIINNHLIEYSKRTGYDLIATADAHFSRPELWRDRELYKLMGWQLQNKDTIDKVAELQEKTIDDLDCALYLKNGDQMFEAYEDEFIKHCPDVQLIEDAIGRTYGIAHDQIERVCPDNTIKLPKTFQVSKDIKTPFDQLKKLCIASLKDRNLDKEKKYIDRTIYELKVIKKIGVSEYFLAKKEILDSLRKHMLLGTARGSGAGSLVCYLLNITMIDPLKHDLLFERFLSESRAELPDIDSDIEDKESSMDILRDHFGSENVLAISNYNRLQLRSLVKDISKLYGIPFQEANALTKVMEGEAKDEIMKEVGNDQKLYKFTFQGAKKYSSSFQKYLKKYPEVGFHIENLFQEIKSTGMHAGGVCIVPDAEKHLPIVRVRNVDQSPVSEGLAVSHLQKYFGVPKFDVLGLATLRIIRKCIEDIFRNKGEENPTIDDVWKFYNENLHPDIIDSSDKKVFKKVYHKGQFPSVFQFAEKGVQSFCKKAKPLSVTDLSVITSIWRPGSLADQGDQKYLWASEPDKAKVNKKEHKIIKEVLGESRHVLCFQEQFMVLANKLAGFTLEESNDLRKSLVKPSTSLSDEMKAKRISQGKQFIDGCIDSGVPEARAKKLWHKEILPFASYGFNKSHAVSYAFNSYQCAWLYTYYESSWIKASLESDPDPQGAMNVVRSLGYTITKPDINLSHATDWAIDYEKKTCTPALKSLKGMGKVGAEELVKTRPTQGFQSLQEVFFDGDVYRYSKFSKTCLQALIRMEGFASVPGAVGPGCTFKNYAHMDETLFGETTRYKKNKYITYKNIDLIKKHRNTIDELAIEASDMDWPVVQKIDHQREIMGFYDKGLIIGEFLPIFNEYEIDGIDESEDETYKRRIWAVVEDVTEKKSGRGNPYLVIKVSGMSEKMYSFKVWNTSKAETTYWVVGNILVYSLEYDDTWGYSVPRNSKIMRVNK